MKIFKEKLYSLEKITFYLLVLFLPSQLGYHFWPDYAFIFGIRVDYLSPTIYLTDILVGILLSLFLFRRTNEVLLKAKRFRNHILLGLVFVLLNTLFSSSLFPTLYKWIKISEIFLLGFYISQNIEIIKSKIFVKTVSLSLIVISLLGIFQVFLGSTLGGIFYFIGERNFSLSTPGIALQSFYGQDILRAYSSFSHPNSFAGYLFVFSFIVLSQKQKNVTQKVSLLLSMAALFLTFSTTAFLGVIFATLLYFLSKRNILKTFHLKIFPVLIIVFSLLLPFTPSDLSNSKVFGRQEIQERIQLSKVAKIMFWQSPIFGKGLNNFVTNLPKVEKSNQYFWFLQPVHNIIWLTLSETGLLGFSVFVYFLFKISQKVFVKENLLGAILFITILFMSSFDHYFFTLQQNMLSLSFALTAAFTLKKA